MYPFGLCSSSDICSGMRFHGHMVALSFSGNWDGKESTCNARALGLIPGWGRSPGEGDGYLHQYSCLKNSMDRRAYRATVHGIAESDVTGWLNNNKNKRSYYLPFPWSHPWLLYNVLLSFMTDDTALYSWSTEFLENSTVVSCIIRIVSTAFLHRPSFFTLRECPRMWSANQFSK